MPSRHSKDAFKQEVKQQCTFQSNKRNEKPNLSMYEQIIITKTKEVENLQQLHIP
jgi:hypothetical protein